MTLLAVILFSAVLHLLAALVLHRFIRVNSCPFVVEKFPIHET
jgi:hypothetical protein